MLKVNFYWNQFLFTKFSLPNFLYQIYPIENLFTKTNLYYQLHYVYLGPIFLELG